jgi:hypothetical protein
MVILAIYYTIADIVLLAQCFYYRGFTLRDDVSPPSLSNSKLRRNNNNIGEPDERTGLLATNDGGARKRVLRQALQKAHDAVELDNAHKFESARAAYLESCNLIRQVLPQPMLDRIKLDTIVSN